MKTGKIFKILERRPDCVLLKKDMPAESSHQVMYQVRDIENDIIYMGYSYMSAHEIFEAYDINKVREERKKVFENWMEEYAEA